MQFWIPSQLSLWETCIFTFSWMLFDTSIRILVLKFFCKCHSHFPRSTSRHHGNELSVVKFYLLFTDVYHHDRPLACVRSPYISDNLGEASSHSFLLQRKIRPYLLPYFHPKALHFNGRSSLPRWYVALRSFQVNF